MLEDTSPPASHRPPDGEIDRRMEEPGLAGVAEGVALLASARVPTSHGEFRVFSYRSTEALDGLNGHAPPEHLACVLGQGDHDAATLVRVHSECATGDLLGSLRCDCGEQLGASLRLIAEEGAGILVYLRSHEGRGIGLARKFRAYQLQDDGADTVDANLTLGLPADGRSYGVAAAILADLGVRSVRLLTNNLDKAAGLLEHGIDVAERIPLQVAPNAENIRYLLTKRDRLGHLLDGLDGAAAAVADEASTDEDTFAERDIHRKQTAAVASDEASADEAVALGETNADAAASNSDLAGLQTAGAPATGTRR